MNPYQLAAAPPAISIGPGSRPPMHMQQQQQQQQQLSPQPQSSGSLEHQQLQQDPQAQLRYHHDYAQQQPQQSMIPRNNATIPLQQPQTLLAQQQQQQQQQPLNGAATSPSVSVPTQGMQYSAYVQEMDKGQGWDMLTGPAAFDMNLSLGFNPDGQVLPLVHQWDPQYGLGNLSQVPMPNLAKARNIPAPSMAAANPYSARAIPTSFQQQQQQQTAPLAVQQHQQQHQLQRPLLPLQQQQTSEVPQQQQHQHQHRLSADPSLGFSDAPSPVPTMPSFDPSAQSSPSPVQIPEYLHQSTSPEMPIKASPVEQQLSWTPWEESSVAEEPGPYATPAHTHTSFDEGSRDDVDFCPKPLKVFTSSKKDDDGEFRKGQQFYLNIQLNEEDSERYQYIRIPKENIVLPCKADSNGKIVLNTSGKRKADDMQVPTSAQEEDVLSLKLVTHLEPEHRVVGPCGRCKDKTPEILRFHPGVNGKPMIDENGMVALRDGHVKLIASAWCASTSHHRGPGTKFSFHVELSNMAGRTHPTVVYEGQSDQVEIYASHGRDKGARKLAAEKSTRTPPPTHVGNNAGPPSPAKTISSPPGSPQSDYYDSGPSKKHRKEDPRMTPPTSDIILAPVIRSLEPSKGPICRENHVIIIGQNFTEGMIPMFGREYGTVIQITPLYIECSTPRYPKTETVRLWIHHPEQFYSSDKTYEFTDEQAQSDLEHLLRTMVQSDADLGDAPFSAMLERLAGLPSSTSISEQSQSTGSTMLHNSVILGYQAVVSMLIEEGIELDIEDDAGFTALDYAILTNNVEITNILLHSGSMLSFERLRRLTLRPSDDMVKLLMDVSDVELPLAPEIPDPAIARVPQLEASLHANSDATVPDMAEAEPVLQPHVLETVIEETVIPENSSPTSVEVPSSVTPLAARTASTAQPPTSSSMRSPSVYSSSSRSATHSSPPTRERSSHRAESIMTTATGSTMRSAAPTMSTMAHSATSANSGMSSMSGAHRQVVLGKGGLENIWQCAKKGNLSLVKYHLKKDPSLLNKPWGFDGRSVLSSACASSRPLELVEYLINLGANINHIDTHHKRTVLHTLAQEGGIAQDEWNIVTPAAQEENEQDVLAAMRLLLDKGAQVDAKNHWKETVLMRLLAARDAPLMVQELYSRGADPRLKSSKDVYPHGTALCYAAFYGRIRSLKWMIENDLLSNDEAHIKEAIRWAKEGKGEASLGGAKLTAANLKRREEQRQEVIRMLESWLGESGFSKRKTLAKEIQTSKEDGWWMRISGIVQDGDDKVQIQPPSPSLAPASAPNDSAGSPLKIPTAAHGLWRDVESMSTLVANQDYSSSQSGKMKWNPLTILRKASS